jgi:hypothetical protein
MRQLAAAGGDRKAGSRAIDWPELVADAVRLTGKTPQPPPVPRWVYSSPAPA